MKRRMIMLVLVLSLLLSGASGAGAISMYLNDAPTTVKVVLYHSTSYVPLRTVTKLLVPDAQVSWQKEAAVVRAPSLNLSAQPGACYLNANGRMLFAKDGIQLIRGSTYVPVRVLAKALGASVTWDSATNCVSLHKGSGTILSGDAYYNAEDLYWLARIIHAESRSEPISGKIAVGNVVLNRVKSPDFPNSIYDVIFDRKFGVQFEPIQNGTIYEAPDEESLLAAMLCLDGASVVGNSLYFLNPAKADNLWAMSNRTYVETIGNHYFYAD